MFVSKYRSVLYDKSRETPGLPFFETRMDNVPAWNTATGSTTLFPWLAVVCVIAVDVYRSSRRFEPVTLQPPWTGVVWE